MSQLDAILKQLRNSLSEKGAGAAVLSAEAATAAVDAKASSQALRDFLSRNVLQSSSLKEAALLDPQLIVDRRKALSAFVGLALTNNGKAVLPGVIDTDGQHGNNKATPAKDTPGAVQAPVKPFTPDVPATATEMTPRPASSASSGNQMSGTASNPAAKNPGASNQATSGIAGSGFASPGSAMPGAGFASPGSAMPGAGFASPGSAMPGTAGTGTSFGNAGTAGPQVNPSQLHSGTQAGAPAVCPKCLAREAEDNRPASRQHQDGGAGATASGDTKSGSPAKTGVAAIFAAFGGGGNQKSAAAKPEESIRETSKVAGNNSGIVWYKHIQSVESALRIGDMHFADSLLALLLEVAAAESVDVGIGARLSSMQARILTDRKQFTEAEKCLEEALRGLAEAKRSVTDISAAYCWRALAQCFKVQNKMEKSEKAREKSIAVAEAVLGEKDPEAMLFREPLSP